MGDREPAYRQKPDGKAENFRKNMGLHYCDHYENIVRFGKACERCPHANTKPYTGKE
ncbi:MAG: hypothetical protein NT016_02975 [Candidatus Aenigmarchaeota archaeon]|nr:hypothetical protein [Candidatus Aenigmarchaeota archaeon]